MSKQDAVDTEEVTDFFVVSFEQLIIGRYRDWGNIQPAHLVILGGAFSLMMMVYIVCLRKRLVQYRKDKDAIPPDGLPLMKEDIGRSAFNRMLNQILFVDKILAKEDDKLVPTYNKGCGDPGWGHQIVDGKREDVHYNTSIAKSFYILENTALSRRPGLYHKNSQTIRGYLQSLRQAFPSLHPDLCEEYVYTYERAVFSDHTFTESEFTRFKKIILILVEMINENISEETDGTLSGEAR